ncbi:hypothetical protein H257_17966 [Aphanomyces astaci]|uniref:Uncharacterized protein n=1 Tax=Aphanomyces astaci TaxID=112090 RepID=W4FEK2_APHAT|nr:hypothetical protein H257_17966 [Aphanomyces astaci]ETV65246.1 hypothetical protein H257_17966 [Aphanomyces astaci]|eukprot:XP_009845247.1 hypothetical protein H257_17966 [Aphanomyces astaci]
MARKQRQAAAGPPSNGYSGGFFLPAQRSMHCQGGFFSSDTKPFLAMPPPTKPKTPTTSLRMEKPAPIESNQARETNLRNTSSSLRRENPRQPSSHGKTQAKTGHPCSSTSSPQCDIESNVNAKFVLALKELRDIKGEYQRSRPLTSGIPSTPAPPAAAALPPETEESSRTIPMGDHSPTKKLKIAETVIRKLYKKNLELEKALVQAKADNQNQAQPAPYEPTLDKPPTIESVQGIESQKDEYLKYLAAEQDKTIQELKRKIETLADAQDARNPGGKSANSTKAAAISRLEKRLQEAIGESSRQKQSYMKLKSDYKRLLLQRTRSISGSSEIDSHARELLALMEKRLLKVEDEREQDMALYNMKLFETEQQNCDDYVAKKMLENEMAKVTTDVKERDNLDDQIEKCMLGVFERLHQVEQENIQLRDSIKGMHRQR